MSKDNDSSVNYPSLFKNAIIIKDALQEYKEFNDPVRQFMAEIMPQLQWDFVPFTFLRDLYTAWYKKNVGDKDCVKSMSTFVNDILNILKEYPEWSCDDKKAKIRPRSMMDNGVNRFTASVSFMEWLQKYRQKEHLDTVLTIPQSEVIVQAENYSCSVNEINKHSPATQAVNNLCSEISYLAKVPVQQQPKVKKSKKLIAK